MYASWAVMLRHLSLYGNLVINPRLIAPSDSLYLMSSEKTEHRCQPPIFHYIFSTAFPSECDAHALLSCIAYPNMSAVPSAGGRRTE